MKQLVVVAGFAGLVAADCAPMSVGPPVVTDVPRTVRQVPVPTTGRAVSVDQHDLKADVHVARLCDVTRFDDIERTTVRTYHNDSPSNDVWAVVAGVVVGAAGVALIADPSAANPKGSEDKLSPNEARAVGYALTGVGVTLLLVPVIDHFREQRTAERRVEHVTLEGPVLRRDQRCGPQVGATLFATFPDGRDVRLGTTDAHGDVRVDLNGVPEDAIFQRDDRAWVHFEGSGIRWGQITLSALYAHRDEVAWSATSASECTTSIAVDACALESAYETRFRSGEHVQEAKQRLEAWRERRQIAAEASAWNSLDLDGCRSPKRRVSGEVEEACQPLAAFVVTFPNSSHTNDVQSALAAGRTIRDRLAAEESRREEAAENARIAASSNGGFIPYAGNGGGPTLCADGQWSHSSGRGTCSHHGGVSGGGASKSRGGSGGHRSGGKRR